MSEKKTYEVLAPVRLHRRSRVVGAQVEAHPDDVADLVGTVLREVDAGKVESDQPDAQDGAGAGAALGDSSANTAAGHAPAATAEQAAQVSAQATAPSVDPTPTKPKAPAAPRKAVARKAATKPKARK